MHCSEVEIEINLFFISKKNTKLSVFGSVSLALLPILWTWMDHKYPSKLKQLNFKCFIIHSCYTSIEEFISINQVSTTYIPERGLNLDNIIAFM